MSQKNGHFILRFADNLTKKRWVFEEKQVKKRENTEGSFLFKKPFPMKKAWIVSIGFFISVQIGQAQIAKDSLVATQNLRRSSNSERHKNGICMPGHPKFYCVTIKDAQLALIKKGYSLKADNKFGKKTKKALSDFLLDNGIPMGNTWGFTEVFEALGIEPCSK